MEYRVLCEGINYPGPDGKEKRVERGDMVRDLPASCIADQLAQGHIESVEDRPVEEPHEEA